MQKEIEIIVPFYDLDPMRVVWHGNYLKYMERARCALLDEYSLNYDDMAKLGYAFPVVTMQAKYIKPAIFGQKIIVKIIFLFYIYIIYFLNNKFIIIIVFCNINMP